MTDIPLEPAVEAFAWPLLTVTIRPKSPADTAKLADVLTQRLDVEANYLLGLDDEAGTAVLESNDEEDLERVIKVLKDQFRVEADFGAPQVAYLETLTRRIVIDHTYKKLIGGGGVFARVVLAFEPYKTGTGFTFENAIMRGSVPNEYIPAVFKGLDAARHGGLIAGFPVVAFKATLFDGAYHDLDSSSEAFEIAAREAFAKMRDEGGVALLEPIMMVRIQPPPDCLPAITADLDERRGVVRDKPMRGGAMDILAEIPLAGLLGYRNVLTALSGGRARYFARFHHYAPIPVATPPDDVFPPAVGMRA